MLLICKVFTYLVFLWWGSNPPGSTKLKSLAHLGGAFYLWIGFEAITRVQPQRVQPAKTTPKGRPEGVARKAWHPIPAELQMCVTLEFQNLFNSKVLMQTTPVFL